MKLAIIDFNRTIYDPETGALTPGALDALDFLIQKGFTLVLISKKEEGRDTKLVELGISNYFAEAMFVEKKTPELFNEILNKYGVLPAETVVLGDHVHSEISAGNAVGAKTIRFRSGKFKDLEPRKGDEPTYTITQLNEIAELL